MGLADSNPVTKKIEDEANNVSNGNVSGVASGMATWGTLPAAQVLGKMAGDAFGMGHGKQDDLNEQSAASAQAQIAAQRGISGQMGTAETNYSDKVQEEGNKYLKDVEGVRGNYINKLNETAAEAADQGKNAKATYSNEIQPRLKSQMEDAQKQAGSAMSLADAGDPNNKIHQAVEKKYNDLGAGVQKQGIADYGVLSALGNQATMNTMGAGGPMTGSQMQLLSANNSQQASKAYQIAAQRMNDLRQQGIDRGFSESDNQYNRGVAANNRYDQSIGNFEGGMDRDIGRQNDFRDRAMGYASDKMGVQQAAGQDRYNVEMGIQGAKRNLATGMGNREMGINNAAFGNEQASIANQMAAANAENAQKAGILGGVIGAAGTGLGAYFGGAQGAQAGGATGRGVAGGFNGYQAPGPQQGQQRFDYGR